VATGVPTGFVPDSGVPDGFIPDAPAQAPAPDTSVSHLASVGLSTAASDLYHGLLNVFRSVVLTPDAPDPLTALVQHQLIDPASEQFRKAKDAYAQGHYSEAVGHAVAGAMPIVGPMAAQVGDLIPQTQTGTREDRARAAGHILAIVGQGAIPEVAAKVTDTVLPAVKAAMDARAAGTPVKGTGAFTADIMKAAPPSQAAPYNPVTIQRAAPYLASEHATAPVTTAQAAFEAGNSARVQIEQHVSQLIDAFPGATIDTDPIHAAKAALTKPTGAMGAKASDVAAGLKALDGFGLDQSLTLRQAENVRNRLNAENDAVLSRNDSDVATALRSDPRFAARYAAVQALRDGIYGTLDDLGVPGVADLRRDEGAVIQMTEAFRRQQYKGDTTAPKTGSQSTSAAILRKSAPMIGAGAGVAAGLATGGPMATELLAAGGAGLGKMVADRLAPPNLTRDAAIARAFQNLKVAPPNLPAVAPRSPISGLLGPAPTILGPKPDTSFVSAVPAMVAPPNAARLLPAHEPTIQLPGSSLRMTSQMQVPRAASRVVRDPATGRFKRVFTSEAAQP
jgi:hypothetical protein